MENHRAFLKSFFQSVTDKPLAADDERYVPIADTDALWLAKIAETHEASFEAMGNVPELTRFFDTHLVLCYRDGPEWYDVHPLIKEHMVAQAKLILERRYRKASERPAVASG